MFSAGKNEQQLGYTIVLEGQDEWINLCRQYVDDEYDYSKVEEELSEESKKRMEWIEENAYRYGFVVRYQQEQKETGGIGISLLCFVMWV